MALLSAALTMGACDDSTSPTEPTSDDPAAAAVSETFSGTLPVGGASFYSFSIAVFGTTTVRLTAIGGPDVPADVIVNLATGTPSGSECSATLPVSVQATGDAGLTNEVTTSLPAGTHCVVVADAGNLAGPAAFTVVIEHP
ncbi:MAG: hypothetical protein AB7J63_11395 [Vicinamibacterales bacterium]